MQKNMKLVLAAVTGIAILGGAAYAGQKWQDDKANMRFEHMLTQYDTNKDGKLSQDEINTGRANALAEFDADKNGTLSLTEYQAYWAKMHSQKAIREFQHLDADGSGTVTIEEFKGPIDKMFIRLDTNKDGMISQDEAMAAHGKHGHGKHGHGKGARHGSEQNHNSDMQQDDGQSPMGDKPAM